MMELKLGCIGVCKFGSRVNSKDRVPSVTPDLGPKAELEHVFLHGPFASIWPRIDFKQFKSPKPERNLLYLLPPRSSMALFKKYPGKKKDGIRVTVC